MAVIIAIWIFMAALGLTAVGALIWAIQSGQLRNLTVGAASIFDHDEPINRVTDSFPNPDGDGA